MQIKYQPLSVENIMDIKRYYVEQGGNVLALRMIKNIRSEISTLSLNPEKAPPYEVVPNIRRLEVNHGNYLVFYRVTQMVEILHIRRSERAFATDQDIE